MKAIDPLCRNCRKSRNLTGQTKHVQPTGLCRKCAAHVATASRQRPTARRTAYLERMKGGSKALSPRPWEYASLKREQMAQRAPKASWWASGSTREEFQGALKDQMSRFKAGGTE